MTDSRDRAVRAARDHWNHRAAETVAEFAELLAIPNVAASPNDLERVAEWISDAFSRRDIEARVHSIPGVPPVVTGTLPGDGRGPTIGVYAHYDGQPVAPDLWASPPFSPTLLTGPLEEGGEEIPLPGTGEPVDEDWRIYARGSSDDRAPISALLAAIDAGGPRHSTIVFLFEGEEEVGSPHLGEHLERLEHELDADVWLICDGPVHQSGRPQVALGVRGFAEVEIEIFGPPHDLHSGHYGETAVNPAVALAELLVSIRDADGTIHIDDLLGPTPSSRAVDAALAVPEPPDLGFAVNPSGTYAERLLRPLVNVRGIRSADTGPSSRNVIPASATGSLDLRLVAGQDPAEAIEAVRRHVIAEAYHLVDELPTPAERAEHRRLARVSGTPGYPGVRTEPDHPMVQQVLTAVGAAGGEDAILLPSFGGSVPLHHFVEHLDAPLAIVPMANHDNNQHSENENLRLGNLAYGIRVMAALMATETK